MELPVWSDEDRLFVGWALGMHSTALKFIAARGEELNSLVTLPPTTVGSMLP